MSEAKHTPGPWSFERDENGRGVIYDHSYLNRHIAYLSPGGVPEAEEEANARLIAAAPDLLAALKELRACISETRGVCAYEATRVADELITRLKGGAA